MPWKVLAGLLCAMAVTSAAPALAAEALTVNPREVWAGTKPVVWSLRAPPPRDRQPASPGLTFSQEVAASKPVLWTLRSSIRQRAAQPLPEQPAVARWCWGTKPVVRSDERGLC